MTIADKERVLKTLYKNLGVLDCYDKDGGIGFGIINDMSPYSIALSDKAYQLLQIVRKKTDETGIEYPFVLAGFFFNKVMAPYI